MMHVEASHALKNDGKAMPFNAHTGSNMGGGNINEKRMGRMRKDFPNSPNHLILRSWIKTTNICNMT